VVDGARLLRPSRAPRLARAAARLRPAGAPVAIGALLAFLPRTTCALRLALGVPCPACGLTRATLALARLDLAGAMRFHPLAPGLAALALGLVLGALLLEEAAWRTLSSRALGGAGVALMVVWALRFAGLFGGPVPA
jgi:Protein of unknown function (DUF2752)